MHRIDAPHHQNNQFTEGSPAQGIEATDVSAAWLNALQEELTAVIALAGIALDKANNGQLAGALQALFAALGHNHNAAYAALGHNHDSAYAAAGHTHPYLPVAGKAADSALLNGKRWQNMFFGVETVGAYGQGAVQLRLGSAGPHHKYLVSVYVADRPVTQHHASNDGIVAWYLMQGGPASYDFLMLRNPLASALDFHYSVDVWE